MVKNDVPLTEEELVNFWTEFINWPKRRKGENNFFKKLLNSYGCRKIFDSCLGDGYDTVSLIQTGFDVTSNEVDPNFRQRAVENAERLGIELKLTPGYDWRQIPDDLSDSFDAVICLGNALTYLMNRPDQEKAVRNFSKIIRPDGIVIIDQRNYDEMLDNRDHILQNPKENFRYSEKFYYCSQTISGYPIHIDNNLVVLEYLHKPTGKKTHLELYPFRREELRSLIEDLGFEVQTFGDFEFGKIDSVDFYQHVGKKK